MKRLTIILITIIVAGTAFGADETIPLGLYVRITGAEEAGAPDIRGDQVLFTYKAPRNQDIRYIRYVGIAFAHEDFNPVRTFQKTENDIFFLNYRIPDEIKELKYRLVVDGLWITDPENPIVVTDPSGVPFSLLEIRQKESTYSESPILQPDGRTTFVYKGRPDQEIYLSGSFNNWAPFMYPMQESAKSGVYTLSLKIPKGKHFYTYLVNGLRVPDPLNPLTGKDSKGNTVSTYQRE